MLLWLSKIINSICSPQISLRIIEKGPSYVEWDYSDPSFPVMIGLREDTPPEIRKRFEEDQKAYEEAYENGILI